MQHFSYGTTPDEIIRAAAREQCPDGYPMTIRCRDEWAVIAAAWNQGIDSHLEALTERSSANASTGSVNVHPDELHVLLRRLLHDDGEEATMLRSDILSTLDIEEV
jgi:hypothetical protein